MSKLTLTHRNNEVIAMCRVLLDLESSYSTLVSLYKNKQGYGVDPRRTFDALHVAIRRSRKHFEEVLNKAGATRVWARVVQSHPGNPYSYMIQEVSKGKVE